MAKTKQTASSVLPTDAASHPESEPPYALRPSIGADAPQEGEATARAPTMVVGMAAGYGPPELQLIDLVAGVVRALPLLPAPVEEVEEDGRRTKPPGGKPRSNVEPARVMEVGPAPPHAHRLVITTRRL